MAVPQVVPAAPLLPPRFSLLSSATLVDTTDERWGNGIAWEPYGCGDNTGVFDAVCSDGSVQKSVEQTCVSECAGAFVVWASKTRSTFDFKDAADMTAQIQQKLLACESKIIEGELYTNSLQLCTTAIASTGAEDVSAASPSRPEVALAVLEQAIADASCGARAMIHVTPFMLSRLVALGGWGLVRDDGNTWVTPSGNLVVPGRGYDGRAPDGTAATSDAEWMYATSNIAIRRGPVQVYPRNLSEAIHRTTNDVLFYAERLAVGQWDSCVHLAIEVDRTACPACN
jgi:hypothetical protein